MEDMKDNEGEWDETQLMTFQQCGNCFTTMGFLSVNSTHENDPDLVLFRDFWTFMDGDTAGGISSSNLFWFLLTVKGADLPERTV